MLGWGNAVVTAGRGKIVSRWTPGAGWALGAAQRAVRGYDRVASFNTLVVCASGVSTRLVAQSRSVRTGPALSSAPECPGGSGNVSMLATTNSRLVGSNG